MRYPQADNISTIGNCNTAHEHMREAVNCELNNVIA